VSVRWGLFHQKSRRCSDLLAWHHRHPGPRFALSRRAAIDNSPAFQRRVGGENEYVPAGRLNSIPQISFVITQDMEFIQPSLRDSGNADIFPGVETPGYFRNVPLGQNKTALRRGPKGGGKNSAVTCQPILLPESACSKTSDRRRPARRGRRPRRWPPWPPHGPSAWSPRSGSPAGRTTW